ncbi:MAG: FtsW/RodA/SpoVE family cell cycle protein, partial [Acidimicrobiaceae bacterium]|nr:FtsW/RodA/SpoVE family cell cycle protein [Acidimicrobiaceae bacterium]
MLDYRTHRGPSPWRQVDILLILGTLAICAFGALMVYTATRVPLETAGLSPTYYLRRQLIFMAIGVVAMVVMAAIDYHRWRQLAVLIYGMSILALLAVKVVGHTSKGAQAWFQLGSFQVEPSEFVKIGLIISLASYLAAHRDRLHAGRLLIVLVLFGVPFALIYKQPDLGTALVL